MSLKPFEADSGLTWRPMSSADLPAVGALEQRSHNRPWSEKTFARELENPCASADVMLSGERLAGYVVSWIIAGEVEIQNIVVAPEWRRNGLARRMLACVLWRAAGQNVRRALLEVRADNAPALALYRQLGFGVDARRAGYYGDGAAAILMSLNDLSAFAAAECVQGDPPGEHP